MNTIFNISIIILGIIQIIMIIKFFEIADDIKISDGVLIN